MAQIMYLLVLSFVSPVSATTLLETTTAVGIANTIQSTGQGNPQQVLNHVKNTVNQNNQAQQAKINQNSQVTGNPQVVGNSQATVNPQGIRNPQATVNPQGIRNPQATVNPQGIRNPQATVNPQGVRNPQPTVNPLNSTATNNPAVINPVVQEKRDIASLTKNGVDLEETLSDGRINPKSADSKEKKNYKAKAMIFYKKDCPSPKNNCQRSGPIFTNLKSVMFDYYHNRMDYQK